MARNSAVNTPDEIHLTDADYREAVVTTDDAGYTVVDGRRIVRPCRRCGQADANYLVGSNGSKAAGTWRRARVHSYSGHYCYDCCELRIVELNAAEAEAYAEAHNVTLEYATAMLGNVDAWVPACGGHEQPMTIGDVRVLYCWNPQANDHAYINLSTDLQLDEHDLRQLGLA